MLNFERITSSGTCSVDTKQEKEKKSVGHATGGNT
jgi:hypothetical protein